MTTVLLVLVCLLGIVVFILLGALVELFQQVQQIRERLDLTGSAGSMPLNLANQGALASTVGLPEALDDAVSAIVLFLTNRCTTCRAIAADLDGAVPPGIWVVAEPVTGVDEEAEAFVQEFRLDSDRTLVDRQSHIAEQLALDVTPTAIFIEKGRMHRAETVPSPRHFSSILTSLKPPVSLIHP
jgi:hypothetical protein